MIKRTHIRQFLTILDTGSFTQAAVRLRLTQPALSSGIAELERLAGSVLLIRDRKQIRLTEAGGRFLPIARDLARGFRAADGFCSDGGVDESDLILGVTRSIAGELLQSIVGVLKPKFAVEVIENNAAELRAGISSGRTNLSLLSFPDWPPASNIVLLYDEPIVMFVSAQHPLAAKIEVKPEELAADVMIARRSCEFLGATSRFFTKHGVRPRFSFRSDNDDRCLRMVAAGIGITTAPISHAIDGVVPLKVSGYEFRRSVGLMFNQSWRTLPAVDMHLAEATTNILAMAKEWRELKVEKWADTNTPYAAS